MSPSESPSATVRLVASASPGTDIFLIDSQFRLVARGVRRLEQDVSPGIYKVKFQAGSAVHEVNTVLEPGAGVREVRCPPLVFTSSAPLAGTRATHEYHMSNAASCSREIHVRDGAGTTLFVFARAWTDPTRPDASTRFPRGQHPAIGLSVHDLGGRIVADLSQAGRSDVTAPDPWSGCTIQLAPGPYRLRLQVPDLGTLEQIVVAPPNWQAQVFLLQEDYGETPPVYRADLAGASILLARAGAGFDPGNDSLRLTELARTALARRRVVVARDLLNQLLETKFENPMLGLYAAHAVAAAPDPDRGLLRIVLQNLRPMLGPHPDVDAIAMFLGEPSGATYAVPPMLRRSWSIVVDRAARHRDLVPAGSLASRAATSIWGDSAWLIWQAEAADESDATGETADLEAGVALIEDLATGRPSSQGDQRATADLDDVEEAMVSYVVRRTKYRRARTETRRERSFALEAAAPIDDAAPAERPAAAEPAIEDATERVNRMAEALGLPPSAIQRKVGRLLRKLGPEAPGTPGR